MENSLHPTYSTNQPSSVNSNIEQRSSNDSACRFEPIAGTAILRSGECNRAEYKQTLYTKINATNQRYNSYTIRYNKYQIVFPYE